VVGFSLIITTSLSSKSSSSLSSLSSLSTSISCSTSWSSVSSCDKLHLLWIHLDRVANKFCRSLRFPCWWEGEHLDNLAVVVGFRLIITTFSTSTSLSLSSILSSLVSSSSSISSSSVSPRSELHLLLIQFDRVANEFRCFPAFPCWWGGERLDDLAVLVGFSRIITTSLSSKSSSSLSSISSSSVSSPSSVSSSSVSSYDKVHLLQIQLNRVANKLCRS